MYIVFAKSVCPHVICLSCIRVWSPKFGLSETLSESLSPNEKRLHFLADLWSQSEFRTQRKSQRKTTAIGEMTRCLRRQKLLRFGGVRCMTTAPLWGPRASCAGAVYVSFPHSSELWTREIPSRQRHRLADWTAAAVAIHGEWWSIDLVVADSGNASRRLSVHS